MSRRGSNAYSISSYGLGPMTLQPGELHPQEWTLPHEHRMEKREGYDYWFTDLQATILNCAQNMTNLLEDHPHPNIHVDARELSTAKEKILYEKHRLQHTIDFIRNDPPPVVYRVMGSTHDNIDYGRYCHL